MKVGITFTENSFKESKKTKLKSTFSPSQIFLDRKSSSISEISSNGSIKSITIKSSSVSMESKRWKYGGYKVLYFYR